MPAQLTEITAIYLRERVRFPGGDTAVVEVELVGAAGDGNGSANANGSANSEPADLFDRRETITIKGDFPEDIADPETNQRPPDALQAFQSYRFYGKWGSYSNKRTNTREKQFLCQTYLRTQPHGRAGVVRYLQNAPNVGQATAVSLWNKFQSDAVRILREQPEVATAAVNLSHFTEAKAAEAAAWLEKEKRLEACTIDLIDLLGGRGFPRSTPKAAITLWGNLAATMIRRNPYLLMRFRGCGFLRCDQMYLEQGGAPGAIKRQTLAAWHHLASDTEGHTWHPVQFAEQGIRAKIAGAELAFVAAIKLAVRAKAIAAKRDANGRLWVTDYRKAAAEAKVAECVADAMKEEFVDWPGISDVRVSEHQEQKLFSVTTGRIGILAGSPGTGKTFTAAALVKAIIAKHGTHSIAICCPTGKAAVRITEAMAGYGIDKRATTIHSLLGVVQRDRGDGWAFEHDADNPLPHRFIVVDESSMIDAGLMASLLAARAKGSHVLFVGDPNQLPPVGHGAPLRDMIAANVPYGELREIRRNAGTIVRACAQIRDGKPFGVDTAIDLAAEPPKNLKVVAATGAEQQIKKMLLAIQCAKADNRDPIWDVQVIVPVNAKSDLGRRAINKILQQELNWQGKVAGGNPFKVGDKIVCLKNSFMPADKERCSPEALSMADGDGKLFVANGELAAVVDVAEKLTIARLSSPDRFIKIPRGNQKDGEGADGGDGDGGNESGEESKSSTGCQWDLGYALSFHKSQGSEWPVVILLADDYAGARRLYSRELWYTGISRAKCLCLIVGNYSTVQGGCRVQALYKRKTFLKELIFERTKMIAATKPTATTTATATTHTGTEAEHVNCNA